MSQSLAVLWAQLFHFMRAQGFDEPQGEEEHSQMSTYAFIDGSYIRKVADDLMQQMFDVPAELDFSRVRLGHRTYYYDCLDDLKGPSESQQDFEKRLDKQIAEFNAIQSLPGFHVRYGSLTAKIVKSEDKRKLTFSSPLMPSNTPFVRTCHTWFWSPET